jgi:hypothetical protein
MEELPELITKIFMSVQIERMYAKKPKDISHRVAGGNPRRTPLIGKRAISFKIAPGWP